MVQVEIAFADAEAFGREMLATGGLRELQGWYSLSDTGLANQLSTNTTTLKSWLDDPAVAQRIQAVTAARIGQFASQLTYTAHTLLKEHQVRVIDLYPLRILAGQLGRSVSSPRFAELCRAEKITCYDTGILGIYVPKDQAEQLRQKVIV